MRQVAIPLAWLVCLAAEADVQSVRLDVVLRRSNTVLRLAAPPVAVVEETRPATLPAGTTTLVFSWEGTQLDPDSLTLAIADEGVQVSGPVVPAGRPAQAEWALTCARPIQTSLTVRYHMPGLTWRPEYTLTLVSGAEEASLSGVAVITNETGEDFADARVETGLPSAPSVDLPHGTVLRLPYVTVPVAPCKLLYVFEPAVSPDTSLRIELMNPLQAGAISWQEGKMRVFEDRAGDQLLVGEVRLPSTPVGEKVEITLGTAREVSVERRVLRIADVDAKKDVHGRLALYNREEEVAFLIESSKNEDILLKIAETIDGEWEMVSNSHGFERKDGTHIEFLVPVASHSKSAVRYRVRRLNVLP